MRSEKFGEEVAGSPLDLVGPARGAPLPQLELGQRSARAQGSKRHHKYAALIRRNVGDACSLHLIAGAGWEHRADLSFSTESQDKSVGAVAQEWPVVLLTQC